MIRGAWYTSNPSMTAAFSLSRLIPLCSNMAINYKRQHTHPSTKRSSIPIHHQMMIHLLPYFLFVVPGEGWAERSGKAWFCNSGGDVVYMARSRQPGAGSSLVEIVWQGDTDTEVTMHHGKYYHCSKQDRYLAAVLYPTPAYLGVNYINSPDF